MRFGLLALLLAFSSLHCSDEVTVVDDALVTDIAMDTAVDVVATCEDMANGTACDDGDSCSLDDTCQGGVCVGGTNKTCDSENPCVIGACDTTSGECTFEELEDGSACAIACFDASACLEGSCVVDTATEVDCSSEFQEAKKTNPCLEDLRCSQTTGACSEEIFVPAGTECNTDSNLCTLEACTGMGVCSDSLETVSCANRAAANPCATHACDAKTGECKKTGFAGPIACDDKNACTTEDTCTEDEFGFQLCKGSPVVVDDNNPCTDDQCKQGTVTHTPIPGLPCPADTNCSDVWLCSLVGACEPGLPNATCDTGNACANPVCNALTGACVQNVEAGFCLIDDECVADGQEQPGNQCSVCDPSVAQTSWSLAQVGATCTDDDQCTVEDTCDGGGACTSGANKECQDVLCATEACDPASGQCVLQQVDNGFCFIDGVCVSDGAVSPESPCLICDSTSDSEGWLPSPPGDAPACADGDGCNGKELCDGQGACVAGLPVECDDGDECTMDTCEPASGACVYQPKPECPVVLPPLTDQNLNGVWGDGEGTVWVVGDGGVVLRHQNGVWAFFSPPACMASHDLLAIDGLGKHDFWIGANQESLMHFDGVTFHCADENGSPYQVQPGPNDHRVHKVWANAPSTILAFRYIKEAAGYLLHVFELLDGGWKNIVMAAGFNATGIQARPVVPCATNNIFLSTFPNPNLGQTNAKLQRFTGQANLTLLNPVQDPNDPIREMRDGVCLAPDDVHMVGHMGQVTHWDGSSLSHTNLYDDVDVELRPTLWGLAGDVALGFVAVGDAGAVARMNGDGWSELQSVTPERLNDVWVTPDGVTWIVGDKGVILRLEGDTP
jgi:hypothetical protein